MYKTMFNTWLETNDNSFKSPKNFLIASFNFMYQRITLNRDLSNIFIEIWEISNYNEKIKEKVRKAYKQWIEKISELLMNQSEDKETAILLSTALVAFFEGLSMFSVMFKEGEFPFEAMLDKFKDFLINQF